MEGAARPANAEAEEMLMKLFSRIPRPVQSLWTFLIGAARLVSAVKFISWLLSGVVNYGRLQAFSKSI